jgi:hypothetical protein
MMLGRAVMTGSAMVTLQAAKKGSQVSASVLAALPLLAMQPLPNIRARLCLWQTQLQMPAASNGTWPQQDITHRMVPEV